MMRLAVDVLVIGSGFAGSLTALLMQRIGRTAALVDKGRHPRFAVGESSTPLADLMLRSLCARYDLPQFLPLCDYGAWQAAYPNLVCGEKRGFSYFRHEPGEPFHADRVHSTELLVTANRSRQTADTHWLRSDVDHFFAREAAASGIPFFESADVRPVSRDPWRWEGAANREPVAIEAEFVVDASGASGVVAHAVNAERQTTGFLTDSSCCFAHFVDVEPWQTVLQKLEVDCSGHPFPADRAAVHHLLDEGWLWQLAFDNGITSIGLVVDGSTGLAAAEPLWRATVSRYPTIADQLRKARIVAPGQVLTSTGRLQRRWTSAVGPDWALLPGTAGFIDPLHSTGIAHSLSGVERLIRLTDDHWGAPRFLEGLQAYERELAREFELVDHLTAACYRMRRNFDLFAAATMLYFVAAVTCEERRLGEDSPGFLATDDERLRSLLIRSSKRLLSLKDVGRCDSQTVIDQIRTDIDPWNTAGLFRPEIPHMYRYTGR